MQRATATWFQFGETLLMMSPLVTTVRISAPEDRAGQPAHAAEQADPADDDGGDRGELEPVA